MENKFNIITLCGSAKFKYEFIKKQEELTFKGNIVLTPVFFENVSEDVIFSSETKQMLDAMHKCKIDISNEILVINKGGYIGSSTKSEIEYAIKKGKKVDYLEKQI